MGEVVRLPVVGKYKDREVLVDKEDLPRLLEYRWCISKSGPNYLRVISLCRTKPRTRLARLVLNAPKGKIVDHINQNPLDNRKENLRLCNKSQNAMNSKIRTDNTSGIRGVSPYRRGWIAQIGVNTKNVLLGYFKCIKDAIKVRKEAEEKYFGEFVPKGGLERWEK